MLIAMSKKEEIIGEVKEVYPWLSRFHTRESGWSFKSKRNSSSQNTEPGTEKPRRPPSAALLEAKEIYPWLDHWHSEDKGWTIPTRAIEEDDEEAAIEPVRTISQVPANSNYYVKDGLRTYGDGVDHETEQPVSLAFPFILILTILFKLTFRRFMILTAMSFLWTGSQIPLYLFGGIIPIIMEDIGGADRYVWILLGNLMPLAAITPFVGALSDLLGRRYAALIGAMFLVLGSIVCATAHIMNVFIGGQVLIGIGAGICELTALAVAGEMAPTKKRGLYVGCVIVTILPYTPSVLYAQEVAAHGSWRWIGLWTGAWSFVGGTLTAIFFFPPSRANSRGLSRQEILKRLDWVGALLSTSGFTLFLAGLTWAGGQYAWSSPHVLWSFVLGIILIISFGIWEMCFAKYPMFPRRLGRRNPRALTVILIITAVSGANFFAVLVFWPTQYYFMYADGSPTSVGVGSLPVGFGIIGGSILVGILVTVLRGKVKLLMIISCAIMTAGNGAMAAADINNVKVMYFPVTLACLGVGAVIIPNVRKPFSCSFNAANIHDSK